MGKTGIEWADVVWNPVTGCTKVSQGCKNCYAKALHDMRHKAYLDSRKVPSQYWVPFEQVQVHENRLELPLKWRKPQRVFVNSMSDLFHEDVPFEFIDRVFATMFDAHRHTFMILTKRPERMLEYMTGDRYSARKVFDLTKGDAGKFDCDMYWPLDNVWLGVSVENQKAADERIPLLIQTPSRVKFVSCEPLLGPVNLKVAEVGQWPDMKGAWMPNKEEPDDWKYHMHRWNGIHWVIAGGESGKDARPMHPDWARGLRDQCQAAGVPFFFKQWGEWAHERQIWKDPMAPMIQLHDAINPQAYRVLMYGKANPEDLGHQFEDRSISYRVGKKAAGRLLDGLEWNEVPGGGK